MAVTVHVIQTGPTLVSPAVPNRAVKKFEYAYTGLFQSRKDRISVPVKAFLVEVNGKKLLIDCGWSDLCEINAKEHPGFTLWFASEPVVGKNESMGHQLKALGIAPSEIDAVLMTHPDCDHASGLTDVKD